MGKATRWFRNLLGLKQSNSNPNPNPNPNPAHNNPSIKPPKDKRRWSFVKSYREKSRNGPRNQDIATSSSQPPNYDVAGNQDEANKHAIAVAAATAAVAEAAVAAANAAAAVVRLTHSGRCGAGNHTPVFVPPRVSGGGEREVRSAVVIQSCFRGYLARRALRALKGLVKLQAIVRGHIMRRKTTETMRCMQAMLRAQARARTIRAYLPDYSPQSSTKSGPQLGQPGPPTLEKFDQFLRAKSGKQELSPMMIKRNGSRSSNRTNPNQERSNLGSSWSDPRMEEPTFVHRITSSTRTSKTDEDRADRILEIDTGRPPNLKRRTLFESDQISHSYTTSKESTARHTVPSPSASCEVVQSLNPLKFLEEPNDGPFCTAENSPQFNSAKSDGSRSFLSGYSDCPSYMSYTESSRAKVRSLSAPKQRPNHERSRSSSTKRYSVHGFGEHNPRSYGSQAGFTSKSYSNSGRLDRVGMPVRDSTVVYYSGYLN